MTAPAPTSPRYRIERKHRVTGEWVLVGLQWSERSAESTRSALAHLSDGTYRVVPPADEAEA